MTTPEAAPQHTGPEETCPRCLLEKAAPDLLAALEAVVARVCVCGHAKENLNESHYYESHYYGDRTMRSPCQHCSCPAYRPDISAELVALKQGRAAIARARGGQQ